MKRVYITCVVTAAAAIVAFSFFLSFWNRNNASKTLTVGFIYEGDESTPYSYNFALGEAALQEEYPGQVEILSRSNVRESEIEGPVRELISSGCSILFANSYSDEYSALAAEYPDVEFCQVSYLPEVSTDTPENYHTFKGEAYQGRYVSGVAAGLKLREMIDNRIISPEEALVGYIAAFPIDEVISGFTAFYLGVRSVVPEATMRVRYTHTWSNYNIEKKCARELLDEGCIVLSQHSDTIGPAVACEEVSSQKQVFMVGYNQSMLSVAPTTALLSTRINWTPYIIGAVGAVLEGKQIEKYVDGRVHGGHDMSAGFDQDWVQVLEFNEHVAANGTQQAVEEVISSLKKGSITVFKGNVVGVNPNDPEDIIDLSEGFEENANSSSPSFHWILQDWISVE